MDKMDELAESRIQEAIRDGLFDHLSGAGRPLQLDNDSAVPPTLGMAFRILKNAGYVPEEVTLLREIAELEFLLDEGDTETINSRSRARLDLLRARPDATRSERPIWIYDKT
jgi:hypothetical protein